MLQQKPNNKLNNAGSKVFIMEWGSIQSNRAVMPTVVHSMERTKRASTNRSDHLGFNKR